MIKDFFQKKQAKGKLIQAFRSGGIYLTYKSGKNDYFIFPTIHHVGFNEKKLTYVFSVPLGLDPKDITKRIWLFEQQFGKNIELKQEIKKFTLTIYNKSIPEEFKYNYEKIKPYIEGMKLPIVGGIDVNGNIVTWDMADGKPHLLAAGENGSGKSAGVRQILTTLVQYKTPDELHLYLCDPKFTEFHLFENIAHVQNKIAFEMKDIAKTIDTVKKELDKRKKLIGEQCKLTGIEKYNEKFNDNKLPYILLCIDEFAQLKGEKGAIETLEIISAQGRAFGVLLLLATQRPDAQVMNGLIKQNITVRMGFRHADLINSRITNTIGAEKISMEDKGRFILKMDVNKEIQAPFLSEEKAEKILNKYKIDPKNEVIQSSNIQTWTFPNVNNEQVEPVQEVDLTEEDNKPKLGLLGDNNA